MQHLRERVRRMDAIDTARHLAAASVPGALPRSVKLRATHYNAWDITKWRVMRWTHVIFAGSLLFAVGGGVFLSGMFEREEDMRVCRNCARQKEIVEEIYFGKTPKRDDDKPVRMMP